MKNAALEVRLSRSAHVYSEKKVEIDESAFALLRNRARYIEQSAATVNRFPAHPPVPRDRALVPINLEH